MNKEEMKNKYSSFITEISEILGLGKPVDILKLCATTDLFFQPLEKRISETEETIDKLQVQNNWLEGCKLELAEHLGKANDRISELEQQIEKMKCCQNCKFEDNDCIEEPCSACTRCLGDIKRKGNSDKWELQENNNEQART